MRRLVALVGLLPSGAVKNALLRRAGFDVHPSADIGPVLLWDVESFSVARGARIGALTAFRGMRAVRLEERARIGQLNWVSSAPDLRLVDTSGVLVVERDAAITNRHYLDCSGGIHIGHHSTVAGVRSTFITHGIDWRASEQSVAPIVVGSHCIVSSNVSLVPGTRVPDRSVVAKGVTMDRRVSEPGSIVADRGRTVKGIDGAYFSREHGVVRPPTV